MINGSYYRYGDRALSDSEVVDDHVRVASRRGQRRRPSARRADNETDSQKNESAKEPRLLRYAPAPEAEDNFLNDRKYGPEPRHEPRRPAYVKKPRNPSDGSAHYAYSRSDSSCSSPGSTLPTIAEHEHGTYRVRGPSPPRPPPPPLPPGYNKLDRYFGRPKDELFAEKGSHPDSLYRVPTAAAAEGGRARRCVQHARWPAALLLICAVLATFVFFLMPDIMGPEPDGVNATYWMSDAPAPTNYTELPRSADSGGEKPNRTAHGSKTPEIDFYEPDTNKNPDLNTLLNSLRDKNANRMLPVPPVFPDHIAPEVQYGNEKADTNGKRLPKELEYTVIPLDSTSRPRITLQPEKPLAVFFNEAATRGAHTATTRRSSPTVTTTTPEPSTVPETATSATSEESVTEVIFDAARTDQKLGTAEPSKTQRAPQASYGDKLNFTSGHSKLFGVSMEDAGRYKSSTQSSLYNTKVSPTLPAWRDADAATSKYATYGEGQPQCRSTRLQFCRGVLPYDLTAAAAGPDVTVLLPQFEFLAATNCSVRLRDFACALLEPECGATPKLPCHNLCRAVVDGCEGLIPRELLPVLRCAQYARGGCAGAAAPCRAREFPCADGTCVPRDWLCDQTRDCARGEDEEQCQICGPYEFKCGDGSCIRKQWLCDGYFDCPDQDDESPTTCAHAYPPAPAATGLAAAAAGPVAPGPAAPGPAAALEPGEQLAGSAPAPSVRRPAGHPHRKKYYRETDADSSKELLMTSDSSNGLRRNYTRRLTPYTRRPTTRATTTAEPDDFEARVDSPARHAADDFEAKVDSPTGYTDDIDRNADEDALDRSPETLAHDYDTKGHRYQPEPKRKVYRKSSKQTAKPSHSAQSKVKNHYVEKKIDGATLMQKALAKQHQERALIAGIADVAGTGGAEEGAARASPCPAGELRCVDGRCIALEQLCDGTVDCSDHADEDNCFA